MAIEVKPITVNGIEVKYPDSADSKGLTRVRYDGRDFYFGPYGSPRSYVQYGIWANKLVKDGEAVGVKKQVKPIAKSVLENDVFPDPPFATRRWLAIAVAFAGIVISFGCFQGIKFYSTFKPVKVDGEALGDYEIGVIRGVRNRVPSQKDGEEFGTRYAALESLIREIDSPVALHRIPPEAMERLNKKYPNRFSYNKDVENERVLAKPVLP